MVHVECSECGDMGLGINKEGSTEFDLSNVSEARICYLGHAIVFHASDSE